MSAQVAMLAGTTALSAFSSIAGGMAQARGYEGQAAGKQLEGMGYEVQQAEVRAQAQHEEYQRRAGLLKLLSANRGDIAGKGVSGEQGSSFDVIQDYNESEAGRDIGNIRFMGESRVRRLSFARAGAEYQAGQLRGMAAGARLGGWMGALRTIGGAAFNAFGGFNFGSGGGMAAAGTPGSAYYGPVYSGAN